MKNQPLNWKLIAAFMILWFGGNHSLNGQVIFNETFGQTTLRTPSSYMPPGAYSFANPNGTANEKMIENGHYAVIAPANIRDGWPVPAWWWWTGPEPIGNTSGGAGNPATNDHTGNANGAVMVVNAGISLLPFYVRSASGLTPGNYYSFSFWRYLVNASSQIKLNIKDVKTGTVLASFNTGFGSTEDVWTQFTFNFRVPAACTVSPVELKFELVNDYANNSGNDYYIDDIVLQSAASGTAISCPTSFFYTDRDNDLVSDIWDHDDDNDAITDADEFVCAASGTTIEWTHNGNSGVDINGTNNSGGTISALGPSIIGSGLSVVSNNSEFVFSGVNQLTFAAAKANNDYVEMSFTVGGSSFVKVSALSNGIQSVAFGGSGIGDYQTAVEISADNFVTSHLIYQNVTIASPGGSYVVSWNDIAPDLLLEPGVTYQLRYYIYNETNGTAGQATFDDVILYLSGVCTGDPDGDGVSNNFDLDSDNDGIADITEAGGVDTNGDGRIDGGISDSDNDGLLNTYDNSTGGDGIANRDTDGDGIVNALDLDSDNDGIQDVWEAAGADANNDGKIDTYSDSDSDGFSDAVDGDAGNDGTAENTSGALIITGTDSNSDGMPETYPRANADAHGLPNPYDLDADGDGIPDTREANVADTDNNGIADGAPVGGSDTNGWTNTVDGTAGGTALTIPNTDGNGRANYLDIDTDNDGITDNIEGQTTASYILLSGNDSDNDGIDNSYDNNDASFGGSNNNGIALSDNDSDGQPDYMDVDADGDGQNDIVEGHDYNLNGMPDDDVSLTGADTDGDGVDDKFDLDNTGPNVTMQSMGSPASPGARGPIQQHNVSAIDRDWRNVSFVLPVSLKSFSAKLLANANVQLNWTVENEEGLSLYAVERSVDGTNFKTLFTKLPNNRSGEFEYAGMDDLSQTAGELIYYRLKMIHIDGGYKFSHIVKIRRGEGGNGKSISVYPNPIAGNRISISVVSDEELLADLQITDMTGRIIHSQKLKLVKGEKQFNLYVAFANKGVYNLQLKFSHKVSMYKKVFVE